MGREYGKDRELKEGREKKGDDKICKERMEEEKKQKRFLTAKE